jgi:hypothetical protein
MKPDINVIDPAYNEASRITGMIEAVAGAGVTARHEFVMRRRRALEKGRKQQMHWFVTNFGIRDESGSAILQGEELSCR